MWEEQYSQPIYNPDELIHYGVVGMKWGVRRANSKMAANEKLRVKALNYDKKAATLAKKSEKLHAKNDIGSANRQALKANKYKAKAAKASKKALKAESDFDRLRYEKKAENLKYKSAKAQKKANTLSKTTGYGMEAMKYSNKADKAAIKAAKARKRIANNELYIKTMNRKVSSLSKEELQGAYAFANKLLDS